METRIGQSFGWSNGNSEAMSNPDGSVEEEEIRIGREGRC
jgi:hypothetical protein